MYNTQNKEPVSEVEIETLFDDPFQDLDSDCTFTFIKFWMAFDLTKSHFLSQHFVVPGSTDQLTDRPWMKLKVYTITVRRVTGIVCH